MATSGGFSVSDEKEIKALHDTIKTVVVAQDKNTKWLTKLTYVNIVLAMIQTVLAAVQFYAVLK